MTIAFIVVRIVRHLLLQFRHQSIIVHFNFQFPLEFRMTFVQCCFHLTRNIPCCAPDASTVDIKMVCIEHCACKRARIHQWNIMFIWNMNSID